jgi:hypothetical protein
MDHARLCSSLRPGDAHLRAVAPPRLRVDGREGQFFLEAKTPEEIGVWLRMLVQSGAKSVESPYSGGPASPREVCSWPLL